MFGAEATRSSHGVDRLALISTLIEEVLDELPVCLVGDAAERADAGTQTLTQPARDHTRRLLVRPPALA
jgi:hypothetical protein